MPPHIKKRLDRGGIYYLVDGPKITSLRTKTKRHADWLLKKYAAGKFKLGASPTLKAYYESWIATKREPLVRRSLIRDYRQHFQCYIVPELGDLTMSEISPAVLRSFVAMLLGRGLSVKTARNVIGGSFRSMWRDALANEVVEKNPFSFLEWPRMEPKVPDPFTAEERDKLLGYIAEHHAFFYPWIFTQFATGMRPSESTALRLADVDLQARTVFINKSRHLKVDSSPKTRRSRRIISVSDQVIELIKTIRLPWETGESHVFYNKVGGAITANEWSGKFWRSICSKAGVAHRKFYSTRHTFITEAVKRGENIKAIADYCGTSIAMIERDYCGRLSLRDQTEIKPLSDKALKNMVVPTGIEPVLPT